MLFAKADLAADKLRAQHAIELQQFKQQLEDSIAKIPDENRIEPKFQVAMNALTDVQACVEEAELRQMFCNLLASSVDADRANQVHPSFPSIIRRMSSRDAVLLKQLGTESKPIATIYLSQPNQDVQSEFETNILAIDGHLVDDRYNVSTSLDVLESLGLIELNFSHWLADANAYTPYETLISEYSTMYPRYIFSLKKGVLHHTRFGLQFNHACVTDYKRTHFTVE